MVLPTDLAKLYRQKASRYNQTASKAEQIALCQFIRDGHLAAQTRRLKRLYALKLKSLKQEVQKVFGQDVPLQIGAAGTSLALTLSTSLTWKELEKKSTDSWSAPSASAGITWKSHSDSLLFFHAGSGFPTCL